MLQNFWHRPVMCFGDLLVSAFTWLERYLPCELLNNTNLCHQQPSKCLKYFSGHFWKCLTPTVENTRCFLPYAMVEWVALLLHNWKVSAAILVLDTGYPDWSFQPNSREIQQVPEVSTATRKPVIVFSRLSVPFLSDASHVANLMRIASLQTMENEK
jgi:hypothetical protein